MRLCTHARTRINYRTNDEKSKYRIRRNNNFQESVSRPEEIRTDYTINGVTPIKRDHRTSGHDRPERKIK